MPKQGGTVENVSHGELEDAVPDLQSRLIQDSIILLIHFTPKDQSTDHFYKTVYDL